MVIRWRHVWPLILYTFYFVLDCTAVVTTKSRNGISNEGNLELLSWAIQLSVPDDQVHNVPTEILDTKADDIATQINLINAGQIGTLKGHYLLHHAHHYQHERNRTVLIHSKNANDFTKAVLPQHWSTRVVDSKDWNSLKDLVHNFLESNTDVLFYSQQVVRQRFKRSLKFLDPAYPRQWHLHNDEARGMDINVVRVWERNITGRGITAAVVDDGLEWHNPDLYVNYNMDASLDLNDKDSDPSPTVKSEKNHHGTRCAGEIAAAANTACAVGVAYNAKIAGLKVLDGPMTDSLEAEAFTKNIHKIDVYSCSWGPDDDGKTVDGPHHLAVKAMMYSVEYGRNGYGSIFVVASGNGGTAHDNCNFDGYANTIYTITIGAVDELGAMPYYAEECASMLAVTFSSGGLKTRNIVTTDWTSAGGTGCTDDHSGTSAAAPLAAGMIALMLDVQPCLTWRDVQHIIVMAAKKVDVDVAHWQKNAAGFHHSHKHGFGLMDAWRLVNTAKLWKPVPWMTLFTSEEMHDNVAIPGGSQPLVREYHVTKEKLDGFNLYTLEYVHATMTVTHARRGDVEVKLHCPSGTVSALAATRKLDESEDGFKEWTFSTVRCWGETPQGTWKIIITDKGKSSSSRGVLVKWQLQLYGSPMSPEEVQERKRLVEKASKGDHLFDNHTTECAPPPLRNHLVKPMSEKILKIIVLTSAFCFLMSLYESFEYIFCYNEEKKEHKRQMRLAARAHREAQRQGQRQQQDQSEDNTGESTRLLDAEEIPLQTIPPSSYNSSLVGEDKIFDPTEYGSRSSSDNLNIPKTNTNTCDTETELSVVKSVKTTAGTGGTTGATYGSDLIASDTEGATARCNPYLPESFLRYQGNGEVPNEMLTCLTPEEIRLNMSIRDESSDEELVFEAKTS